MDSTGTGTCSIVSLDGPDHLWVSLDGKQIHLQLNTLFGTCSTSHIISSGWAISHIFICSLTRPHWWDQASTNGSRSPSCIIILIVLCILANRIMLLQVDLLSNLIYRDMTSDLMGLLPIITQTSQKNKWVSTVATMIRLIIREDGSSIWWTEPDLANMINMTCQTKMLNDSECRAPINSR